MNGLLLFLGLAASAQAAPADLSGVYRCEGRACALTITRVGDVYRLRWTGGEEGVARLGVGVREGDLLTASCCVGARLPMVMVYAVGRDRRLSGKGTGFPGDGRLARESYAYQGPLPWRAQARAWKVGDRVLAAWSVDDYWYPATVQRVEGGRYQVAYQDSGQEWTDASLLLEDDIRPGDRVSARWNKASVYYDGTVKARRGDVVEIEYDDGDRETTTISAVRVKRPREAAPAPPKGGAKL